MQELETGMRHGRSPAGADPNAFKVTGKEDEAMELAKNTALLIVGFILLIKGADFFVEGASGFARKFGISELIIGLTIVAMGTSAPEAAVSITGAISGNADISIGNVLGSNILNVFLILGTAAAIIPIGVGNSTVKKEMPFLILVTMLFILLGLDGKISRIDAGIFLILLAVYLVYLYRSAVSGQAEEPGESENEKQKKALPIWQMLLFIVGGAIMIVLGSNFAVDGAKEIAALFGMSERLIGLTVIAIGTSLPELVTSVTAARKGNADIAIGNVVGSNLFNVLFIIGLTAMIRPMNFARNFITDGIVATVAAVLLWLLARDDRKVGRRDGFVLLGAYAAYFIYIMFV